MTLDSCVRMNSCDKLLIFFQKCYQQTWESGWQEWLAFRRSPDKLKTLNLLFYKLWPPSFQVRCWGLVWGAGGAPGLQISTTWLRSSQESIEGRMMWPNYAKHATEIFTSCYNYATLIMTCRLFIRSFIWLSEFLVVSFWITLSSGY